MCSFSAVTRQARALVFLSEVTVQLMVWVLEVGDGETLS